MELRLVPADLDDPRLVAFLQAHLHELAPTAPPESRHALDLTGLRDPAVRMWAGFEGDVVVAAGALKAIGPRHLELKSMRTDPARRGAGLGRRMLAHLVAQAREQGARRVSLETGSMAFFAPARALYRRFGFVECEPFADYRPDPNSTFMTLALE